MNSIAENVVNLSTTFRGVEGLLDMDLAEIYGVETRQINQLVKTNPQKLLLDLYYFKLTKQEKEQLINLHTRYEKLKYYPSLPNFFNKYGIIMLGTILTTPVAIEVCHVVVRSFVETKTVTEVETLLQTIQEQNARLDEHDLHIQALAREILNLKKQQPQAVGKVIGFQPKALDE